MSRTDSEARFALKDAENSDLFFRHLRRMEQALVQALVAGEDFKIVLEVRGVNGRFLHCRITTDATERPAA